MFNTVLQIGYRYEQLCKYIIAGGSALVVNIVVLYSLTTLLGVYYLASTVAAFCISFCVSFVLQKFWTFKDHSREQLHVQLPLYLGMQLMNLAANTALMFVFVEYLHLWYIFSQILIALGLAVTSFFINKAYIFKTQQRPL